MAAGDYERALDACLKLNRTQPGDAEVIANLGICHFHLNDLALSETYLFQALNVRDSPPDHVFLYLGKVFHARNEFGQAALFYKKFLQKISKNHPLRAAVKDDIRRCAAGRQIKRQEPRAAVVNLGGVVNTAGDEFKPLPSPASDDRLYFSAVRPGNAGCNPFECKADMFVTDLADGDWEAPRSLSVFLNSIEHEMALDFNEDGSLLYFFRGKTMYSGDILVDTFRANVTDRTLISPEFISPMQPWTGDCSPYFFKDTILLFASRRAGGYGGLDLYLTSYSKGAWGLPENLGPNINSAYDESSPFLAVDGRTLYFSTNDARRSMGGYDILTSTYLDHTQRWTPPENLGIPLNSAADDDYFWLTPDGTKAFFSSARKQGLGQRDLYVAMFDQPRPEQAAVSLPAAFHLVPAYRAALAQASEAPAAPGDDFFENISTFKLEALPCPEAGMPLPAVTASNLHWLAVLMKKYPALKVSLNLHTSSGGNAAATCASAFRQVEDLLRQEGVGGKNLLLRCAGDSWPVSAGLPEANRRFEIFFANPEILPFEIQRQELPAGAYDARFFQKNMSGFCYQVVVDASKNDLQTLSTLYPKGMTERQTGQLEARFTLGFFLTFASATEWRQVLERDGYTEARVAAYLNGWELSKTEAAAYVEQFPDLKNFIEN